MTRAVIGPDNKASTFAHRHPEAAALAALEGWGPGRCRTSVRPSRLARDRAREHLRMTRAEIGPDNKASTFAPPSSFEGRACGPRRMGSGRGSEADRAYCRTARTR